MQVSVAGWEVRRLCSGGGGSVLRNTEAVGCGVGEVDVGVGGGVGVAWGKVSNDGKIAEAIKSAGSRIERL